MVAEKVKSELNAAVEDVSKVKKYEEAKYSLGISFIRPYIANPNDFDANDYWDQMSDRSLTGADFCAMHLCPTNIWVKQKDAIGFPGIIMAGKFVKE